MPEIVPATNELVRRFTAESAPMTFRALAVVDGDEVLGVTGFYPDQGRLVLFAGISERTRARRDFRRILVRGARAVLDLAAERGMPVHSVADPAIPGSDVLLSHLGFEPLYKETYAWRGSQ